MTPISKRSPMAPNDRWPNQRARKWSMNVARLLSRWLVPFVVILVVSSPTRAGTDPYVPIHDSQIVLRLSAADRSGPLPEREAENQLEVALERANQVLTRGIELQDPRLIGRAQALLLPWWETSPEPPKVALVKAQIAQNQHLFPVALDHLRKLLARTPNQPQALRLRAMVLTVMGRGAEAVSDCRQLQPMVDRLTGVACLAHAYGRIGQATWAYTTLSKAYLRARRSSIAERHFATLTLADLAERLDLPEARAWYEQALRLRPNNVYGRARYVDFLLDRHELEKASRLTLPFEHSLTLKLRHFIAEQGLGRRSGARDALEETYAIERQRAGIGHLGAEARFRLFANDDPDEALRLATANWRIQKEPKDARLVLMAALAAGDPKAAQPVLEFITNTGLEDVRLDRLIRELEARS